MKNDPKLEKTVLILMDASDRELASENEKYLNWIDVSYAWLGKALRSAIDIELKSGSKEHAEIEKRAITKHTLECYLYKINEYVDEKNETELYKNLEIDMRTLGNKERKLLTSKHLTDILNMKIETLMMMEGAEKDTYTSILKNKDLIYELGDYGLVGGIGDSLKKIGYELNSFISHTYFAHENFDEIMDTGSMKGCFRVCLNFYIETSVDEEEKEKTYAIRLLLRDSELRGINSPFAEKMLKLLREDDSTKTKKNLGAKNVLLTNISEEDLKDRCFHYGELLHRALEESNPFKE